MGVTGPRDLIAKGTKVRIGFHELEDRKPDTLKLTIRLELRGIGA